MNDLISVIVPVYNVERYLENCVSCILKQTYTKLEIILVDDGSPDRCGIVCDSFAEKDSRIRVIHKENGGLSDARNVGLDVATGEYILFVDSDDYIPKDSIEYLYNSLKANKADIAVGKLKMTSKLDEDDNSSETYCVVYSKNEAMNQLFYANKYSVAAPGKLYLASLFEDVRFPKGKLHEDVFTTYKVFLKSNRVFYGDKLVYYYYHRPGSITVSKFTDRRLHIIEALDQIENEIQLYQFNCINGFASQTVEDLFMLLGLNPDDSIIHEYRIWERIKKFRRMVLFDTNCSKRVRGYALISYLGRHMSTKIYNIYQNLKWNHE